MDQLKEAAKLLKNQQTVRQLLDGADTKRMMELLSSQGGVQQAAKAAAAGDTAKLMDMVNTLMSSPEGAQVVERITKQANQAGL